MSERKSIACKNCGTFFLPSLGNAKKGYGIFCSRSCHFAHRTIPLEIRFWKSIGETTASGCILWNGWITPRGYGSIGGKDATGRWRHVAAHRLSYELAYGPIPDRLCVCHKCDNPRCVNHEHLFLGTTMDNIRDRHAKGHSIGARGELGGNAKLTESQVREIRKRYASEKTSYAKLGREYGVGHNAILLIVRRINWKHVT